MTKRLKILSPIEIKRYYAPPLFTSEDQKCFFSLDIHEESLISELRTYSGKFYFILLLGYFKATQQFYRLKELNLGGDVSYIIDNHFPELKTTPGIDIGKDLRLTIQNQILKLLDYKLCSGQMKEKLYALTTEIVSIDGSPTFIFNEMVHFLQKQRVVLPKYTFFQDLIGATITKEEKRLSNLLKNSITPELRTQLNGLLEADNGLHELTYLKKELKNFGNKQIKDEIRRLQSIRQLYEFSKQILPQLKISISSIKYYASLIGYYNVYKLKRMDMNKVTVYLLCFIFYRYRRTIDNLVECFTHSVATYTATAKKAAKAVSIEQQANHGTQMYRAAQVLELFLQEELDTNLFGDVKRKVFEFLPQDQLVVLTEYLKNQKFDITQHEWDYYVSISKAFKRNLRPLLTNISFAENGLTDQLMPVINFLTTQIKTYNNIKATDKKEFMLNLIPAAIKKYIYDKTDTGNQINLHRYEFMAYQQIKNSIAAGSLFVPDSSRYRSLEEDLIDESFWQNNPSILQTLGLEKLTRPIEDILEELETELGYWLTRVNSRIKNNDNPYVKLTGEGDKARWSLPYAKLEEPEPHNIFNQIPQIGIADLLMDNNNYCSFLECFTPITLRYTKSKAEDESLVASLIALGTYIGLGKMGSISDISFTHLSSTTNSLIRLETLRKANDKISNTIAKLPICKYYNIMDDVLHASTDGSKIETQIETVNARYSSKYFGLNKGVSAMTLVVNHIPVNSKLIGAHEYEGHHVFDLLFNNTSEVQPDILSTDTHGTNNINFAILYLFDYTFAPRYADMNSKIATIYSFRNPKEHVDYVIKPTHKANKDKIISEWPAIKKIMVSLATKSSTQSTIVSKLCSYERKNQTKSALWELDNIIRSIHLLRYIDDITYRQNIQKALNRGESYHKLRRAISYANGGKLRVRSEMGQQIYNECGRLLANNMLLYNGRILSDIIATRDIENDEKAKEEFKRTSPATSPHINVYGNYIFKNHHEIESISQIVSKLKFSDNSVNELDEE